MKRHELSVKKHITEMTIFRSRAITAAAVVALVALALIIRLGYLQLKNHKLYSTLSQENLLSIIPLKPNRGLIYDRNGILLAKNIPAYTLSIIPESIDKVDDLIAALQQVLPLSDDEIKKFHHILYQYRPYQPVPLKYKLSEEQVAKFYINQYHFPGVFAEPEMMRHYPLNSITSDAIGYVGQINSSELARHDDHNYSASDSIGKMGIEKYYEAILHGKAGSEEAEINASGHVVRILKKHPPVPGKDIYLTIDSQLQQKSLDVLGKESGAVVAIDPQTGEILALVSNPSYDPNPFVKGISQKAFKALLNSPLHPLYNRSIRGQFAPGSTLKPFYALSSLDEGIITTSYRIFDRGFFQLPNNEHVYHDWKRWGHGWVNVTKAIMVSCDTFFYNLAVNMGIARLDHVLDQFGFGKLTQIDMPEEVTGLVPTPDWKRGHQGHSWYTGDTIETGIGQGYVLATPLQLAQATATLANHGKHFQPHLLYQTVNPDGTITKIKPVSLPPIVLRHPKVWGIVINAMRQVIDGPHGTGHYFGHHSNFSVAAKTGTAQVYGHQRDEYSVRTNIPKRLRNNHLFITFAPVDHPQIALAVVVEHSAMADRMAGDILRYYFNKKQHEHTQQ
jgi:penicillin-binding protein 2